MLAYAAGRVGVDRRLPAGSAVALHAMAHLAGLYSRLGWVTISGVFDEEHIPHVRMVHWGGDPTAGTPNLLAPPPPPPPPSPMTEGDPTPAANPAPGPGPVIASSSHVCLAVADVEASCAYFGLWGFVEDRRFLTGGRRAMWLRAAWPALGGEVLELVLMGDLVAQVAVVRHGGVEMELLRRQAVLPPGKAPAPDW
ncbi:hypothetical protein I4F81_010064 [Pyropia yezoensis]|uniref:Uncharacterized protein n=1 Tax=Pyropia yezoensis TaxID=2788 RepID=A0ACC3CCL8_PYRYE|nr:hypothetical protein I4F81_010064 [Neopyropia yezoensis]